MQALELSASFDDDLLWVDAPEGKTYLDRVLEGKTLRQGGVDLGERELEL